jgi:hypothetical protein
MVYNQKDSNRMAGFVVSMRAELSFHNSSESIWKNIGEIWKR